MLREVMRTVKRGFAEHWFEKLEVGWGLIGGRLGVGWGRLGVGRNRLGVGWGSVGTGWGLTCPESGVYGVRVQELI